MPLSFLGKSYPASFPAIAATATSETATFFGSALHPQAVQPEPAPAILLGADLSRHPLHALIA